MNREHLSHDYAYEHIQISRIGSCTLLELNRPEVHNALNPRMIWECTHALGQLMCDSELRVLMLSGRGKHFCSGADLDWLKGSIDRSEEENLRDTEELALLFKMLYHFPQTNRCQNSWFCDRRWNGFGFCL